MRRVQGTDFECLAVYSALHLHMCSSRRNAKPNTTREAFTKPNTTREAFAARRLANKCKTTKIHTKTRAQQAEIGQLLAHLMLVHGVHGPGVWGEWRDPRMLSSTEGVRVSSSQQATTRRS